MERDFFLYTLKYLYWGSLLFTPDSINHMEKRHIMNDLKNEIHDYWTNRARGYSEYNQQEMADARRTMWRDKLLSLLKEEFPQQKPEEIKILDVGTGPGFFAILLAEAGYQVTAIDYTEEMLKEAQQNAGGMAKCIVWKTGDAQALDVENNSFDVIVTRNVTWNLPRPDLAYREWLRVLKPGGVLYNFDADWYGHLYNEEKREDGRNCSTGSVKSSGTSEMGSGNHDKNRISGCIL